jgi:UDP-glucose 4-epimerase
MGLPEGSNWGARRMKIAVTGGSGFIGSRLLPALRAEGHSPVPLVREALEAPAPGDLEGVEAVVHLAGIAHTRGVPEAGYRAVNTELPVRLAEAARRAGVRRFVFISSSHADSHTQTAYGASKAEAERRLALIEGIELVVLRPVLVYGSGAKGNVRRLVQVARLPLPLPLGAANNRHSLVSVGNLVGAIGFCLGSEAVVGRIFTVTDPGPALSLAEIIGLLRRGLGRRPLLFGAPWLPRILALAGAGGLAERLFAEAAFDGSALTAAGWRPPETAETALMAMARADSAPPRHG